jgi:hypothetical protein
VEAVDEATAAAAGVLGPVADEPPVPAAAAAEAGLGGEVDAVAAPPVGGAVAHPAHASAARSIAARAVCSPPVRRTTRLMEAVLGVGKATMAEEAA